MSLSTCDCDVVKPEATRIEERELDHDGETMWVEFADIPSFLQDGAFYRSFNVEHDIDCGIEVPLRCFCQVAEVLNLLDFERMLRVAAFWGLDTIPDCLIKFCCDHDLSVWAHCIDQTSSEVTFAHELRHIFRSDLRTALPSAIELGKTEIVKFLTTRRLKTTQGAIKAAGCGRLDYLTILHACKIPWNASACAAAAEGGHLDCLQYLHENGCGWDYRVYINAAKVDSFSCIEYACEKGLAWRAKAGGAIAKMNQFKTLIYAIEHGCPIHRLMLQWAVVHNSVEFLQYLIDQESPVDFAMEIAALRGNTNLIHFLHEAGVPWKLSFMNHAAQYNHFESVQYMHANGCPWSADVPAGAAKNGNLEMLRYCFENGCPCYGDIVQDAAGSSNGSAIDCVRYLVEEQGMYMDESGEVFAAAFGRADIHLMTYLLDAGCPYNCQCDMAPYFSSFFKNFRHLHRYNVEEADEYRFSFSESLLGCVRLAVERNFTFSTDFLQILCEGYLHCKEYFEFEGYAQTKDYHYQYCTSSDDFGDDSTVWDSNDDYSTSL